MIEYTLVQCEQTSTFILLEHLCGIHVVGTKKNMWGGLPALEVVGANVPPDTHTERIKAFDKTVTRLIVLQ